MTGDEMVGWHHVLNGHEFEKTLGDGEGQGSLVCCSSRGCKESDTTEQLNNTPGCSRAQGSSRESLLSCSALVITVVGLLLKAPYGPSLVIYSIPLTTLITSHVET